VVRLTRHARNRLRWIARRHPGVSETLLLETLPRATAIGYDERGNRRARVAVGITSLILVIDEAHGVIITIWVE
jgi:hypothetical protein